MGSTFLWPMNVDPLGPLVQACQALSSVFILFSHYRPRAAKMVVNDLSYPEHSPLVVVLLDSAFDTFIYFKVRNQVSAYLIADLSHFIITAKEIVHY